MVDRSSPDIETAPSPVRMRDFIKSGITQFKEHELREIVAVFCKLPGIAPTASHPAAPTGPKEDWPAVRKLAAELMFGPHEGDARCSAGIESAWCQPMDCGKHTSRKFLLYFEDADRGIAVFDNEAEAREAFDKANVSWNCYLFGALPLTSPNRGGAK